MLSRPPPNVPNAAPAREVYPVVAAAVVLGEESATMTTKIWNTRGAKGWKLVYVRVQFVNLSAHIILIDVIVVVEWIFYSHTLTSKKRHWGHRRR